MRSSRGTVEGSAGRSGLMGARPLVGVSCCFREISGARFHTVLDRYLNVVSDVAACDVVLIPAMGDRESAGRSDLRGVLGRIDGLLLTGGRSMVGPIHYGGDALASGMLRDEARDATTLPLVRLAIEMEVPLLGICRGLQEICCALGGTLVQDLGKKTGRVDHLAPAGHDDPFRYRPRHGVRCVSDGGLAAIAARGGCPNEFLVNSLHRQGIEDPGPNLTVEARSDDDLIEAVRVSSAATFAFGVQWHPEWHQDMTPFNRLLFEAFGASCRTKLRERRGTRQDRR